MQPMTMVNQDNILDHMNHYAETASAAMERLVRQLAASRQPTPTRHRCGNGWMRRYSRSRRTRASARPASQTTPHPTPNC